MLTESIRAMAILQWFTKTLPMYFKRPSKDSSKNLTKDTSKDSTKDLTKNLTKDLTKNLTKDTTKDLTKNFQITILRYNIKLKSPTGGTIGL